MRTSLFAGAALAALVIPAAAHAQETTSSIRGEVISNGAPASGVDVTITHVPSGTTNTVTTNEDGTFNANGLRVGGPFSISASNGSETGEVSDIFLTAGQPFRVSVDLQAAEILVTGTQVGRETSQGPITSLNRTDIEGAASINRDIRDLARRDPFATIDPTNSRTIEIAGQNGRLNRFSVDGVQMSDDFGLNNGGLPTSRGPVPFDAIEQFSVKVAPFDIAEGDFQGGAINVVIRSGTNDLTGSAFFTYTDQNLTGKTVRGAPITLGFDSKQYGGTLAGPIFEDKLFFMVSYEKTKEADPFDDGVGPGFANQVAGISLAQIDNVNNIASTVYGYDTMGLLQNAIEQDEKVIAKLDWNVTDDHRAALTYIRNVGTQQFQQNTFTTPPQALGLQSNGYELAEEVNTGVLQINSSWSDDFSTELRVSYRDTNRDQTPFGGRDFSQFEVCLDAVSGGSATTCTGSRLFFGPDVSRQANDLNLENFSVDLSGTWTSGAHTVKGMLGFTAQHTYNVFLQNSLGNVYFDSLADFQARRANRIRLGGAVPSLNVDDAAADFKSRTYTIGIQDDIELSPELQLTAGVRYDYFDMPTEVPLNPNFQTRYGFSNQASFDGRSLIQPRIGFNWTPTSRLVVRGGIGVFGGGTPDVFVSNSFSNTGLLTNQIDINRAGCAASSTCAAFDGVTGRGFPASVTNFLTTNVASLQTAPVNAIDPGLDVASQARATLSVNYDADLGPLGEGWLFGADVLWNGTIDAYQWTDLRSVQIGTLPDGRPRYNARGAATTNQDLFMTNSYKGRTWIGVLRMSKSFGKGLSFDGSYTRSSVKDSNAITSATAGSLYGNNAFLDPNRAAYGTSIYQIKDQWKFAVDFNRAFFGDYKTRLNIFGEYRSGRPYSLTALDRTSGRSPVYGTVGVGGRQLLYVPTDGDTKVSFDSVASQTAFNNLVTSLGLEKYRGRIVPKNSQQSPDFFKVDLHLSQEIPTFIGSSRFELFADVENVLNLINDKWGVLQQNAFPSTAAVVDVACLTAATPTGTAGTVNTTPTQTCAQYRYSAVASPVLPISSRQSLYQIRVGAKVKF
jgi:outer membrane receptor for ferrienterochelin and colicin